MSKERAPNREVGNFYQPWYLFYHGNPYLITPHNTIVVTVERDPEYSYALYYDPESKQQKGDAIFNEYVVDWLTGESKNRSDETIEDAYGWKILPIKQKLPDETDLALRVHHDSYDVRSLDEYQPRDIA